MIDSAARDAWGTLTARLRPFITQRVASSADADDVLQEVFLRMQRSLPTLRDDDRFGPWVYRVARSAVADYRRQRARHPLTNGEVVEVSPEPDDEREVERMLAAHMAPFVATLPSPYREAITLTELEGFTQKEAAERAGVSLTAMKSRVQRGREKVLALLKEGCDIAVDARGRIVTCAPRATGKKSNCRCD